MGTILFYYQLRKQNKNVFIQTTDMYRGVKYNLQTYFKRFLVFQNFKYFDRFRKNIVYIFYFEFFFI